MSAFEERVCTNWDKGSERPLCVIDFAGNSLLREVGAVMGHAWRLGYRLTTQVLKIVGVMGWSARAVHAGVNILHVHGCQIDSTASFQALDQSIVGCFIDLLH